MSDIIARTCAPLLKQIISHKVLPKLLIMLAWVQGGTLHAVSHASPY